MDRNEAVRRLRELRDGGEDLDRALATLRAEGAGPIQSIWAVKEVEQEDLSGAKKLVHTSEAWRDFRGDWEKLDRFLEDVIRRAEE